MRSCYLAGFIMSICIPTLTIAENWRNNYETRKAAKENEYAWVYFGHEEKIENAGKFGMQYYSGGGTNATNEIAKIIVGDIEGLADSMKKKGIDPGKHRISLGRLEIKNEWKQTLGGGNFEIGSTGWNLGAPSWRNYAYVTKSDFAAASPSDKGSGPPTRNPSPPTPSPSEKKDPSGLLLGVNIYQTANGWAIASFLPGYESNTSALQVGDIIKAVAVNGAIMETPTPELLRRAKSLIGPNQLSVMKILRPGIGFMYPQVTFSVEGGTATTTFVKETPQSRAHYQQIERSLP